MGIVATFDSRIFYNPGNRFTVIRVKTSDTSVPENARSAGRFKDHLIRFTATGYDLPLTDAVDLELDGEWVKGKHGVQLQVEQWSEIVAKTEEGVAAYLGSGLSLSEKQETEVQEAFCHNLSIITGSPGTGKTTVLKMILEIYRKIHPDKKILLMAPTGRASRRMAESTGFDGAKTLHNGLGLVSEEDENGRSDKEELLDAGLIIVDEFSMSDMWLSGQFFSRVGPDTKVVLVGDPDQLPSVGVGGVFQELIQCGLIPVTVLNRIFRQSKDSLIAYNAKFIKEGSTKLYFGNDFFFLNSDSQGDAAGIIMEQYCRAVAENGIEKVQILSPFRSEGEASAEQLNVSIRELVNPFRSAEDEIRLGTKNFRIGDRII